MKQLDENASQYTNKYFIIADGEGDNKAEGEE